MIPSAPVASPDVTQLLHAWYAGDTLALERLVPLVYAELRRLARGHLRRERGGHTLQPTAVVHEAWVRLAGQGRPPAWRDRRHFYAVAARVMRRVLVDHARARHAAKRGGSVARVTLDEARDAAPGARAALVDLLALDQALTALARVEPRQARILELRHFGGLTVAETADVMGLSTSTVVLEARLARAFLLHHARGGSDGAPAPGRP